MIENVVRLLHVNPGFDPENLVRVSVQLPWEKYDRKREKTSLLLADLRERFAALPGVKAVGIEKESGFPEKFNVDDGPQSVELHRVGCGVEESDLFRAMRVPLLAGRYFNRDDIGEGTGTAIINETMAQLCWPEEVAVGRKFRAPGAPGAGDQVYEVVGVVGDIRDYSYDQDVFPTFYRPYQELDLQGGPPTFLMRIQTDLRALTPVIRKELKAGDGDTGHPRRQTTALRFHASATDVHELSDGDRGGRTVAVRAGRLRRALVRSDQAHAGNRDSHGDGRGTSSGIGYGLARGGAPHRCRCRGGTRGGVVPYAAPGEPAFQAFRGQAKRPGCPGGRAPFPFCRRVAGVLAARAPGGEDRSDGGAAL